MIVDVYFNLHKKLYSIRACEGPNKGRVIAHRHTVTLIDPTFKVSQAGRARVLKERKKNVHATVRGGWFDPDDKLGFNPYEGRIKKRGREITYNPYEMCSFSYWNDIGELMASTVLTPLSFAPQQTPEWLCIRGMQADHIRKCPPSSGYFVA